jgi:hypothetical protein
MHILLNKKKIAFTSVEDSKWADSKKQAVKGKPTRGTASPVIPPGSLSSVSSPSKRLGLAESRENKKDPTKAPEGDLDEVRAASHLALSAGAERDRFLSVCRHTRTSQGDGSLKVVAIS